MKKLDFVLMTCGWFLSLLTIYEVLYFFREFTVLSFILCFLMVATIALIIKSFDNYKN